jgi:hypothetical protein
MRTPLVNPIIIELKVKTPVRQVRAHFSTAISSPSEWFKWDDVIYDKDGLPIKASLTYWEHGSERKLKTVEFSDRDFANGLQAFLRVQGTGLTVQYTSDGEWDIDAEGADSIMQYAIYDDIIMS